MGLPASSLGTIILGFAVTLAATSTTGNEQGVIAAWEPLKTDDEAGRAARGDPHISGALATVWMLPSGVQGAARFWEGAKGVTFWNNTALWKTYLARRDSDAALLKHSLGDHPRAAVVINFEAYLADTAVWGAGPLQRLGLACQHFATHGTRPILLLGDPELYGKGTWAQAHDVVRNGTAQSYLLGNIARTLAVPGVAQNVMHVSTYWMGYSCGVPSGGNLGTSAAARAAAPPCTEAQVIRPTT